MAQPDSTVHGRATFATKHLWTTAFAADERFPAGPYPNAHAGGAGLPAWASADRNLDVPDATPQEGFGCPDLTLFCRLDEVGLVVTGQRLEPDRAVLACRAMRQTFMPNRFSALRNAIFSLSSRGRSTARNQSVPSLMPAKG